MVTPWFNQEQEKKLIYEEMLTNGSADTIAVPFEYTKARAVQFHLSSTIYQVRITHFASFPSNHKNRWQNESIANHFLQDENNFYVHRVDKLGTSWWRMFLVYDQISWATIGLLFVLQCLFGCLVAKLETRVRRKTTASIRDVSNKWILHSN